MKIEGDKLIIEKLVLEGDNLLELFKPYENDPAQMEEVLINLIRIGLMTVIQDMKKKEMEKLQNQVDSLYHEIKDKLRKDLESKGITDEAEIEKQFQQLIEQAKKKTKNSEG